MPVINVEPEPREAFEAVTRGLRASDREKIGEVFREEVAATLREDGEIVGGACGEVWGQTLWIDVFWIDSRWQSHGHGQDLLKAIESKAMSVGAVQSCLDTFTFGARGFYEKQGYRVFGEMKDYFKGHDRFWMRKTLEMKL
jgi:GNAT superfamily N-acetyltransferase